MVTEAGTGRGVSRAVVPVVTELDPDTEFDADLRDAVAGVPYDRLIDECRGPVDDAAARQDLENRGYTLFQQRDMVPLLRRAITEATSDAARRRGASIWRTGCGRCSSRHPGIDGACPMGCAVWSPCFLGIRPRRA